MSRKPIGAYRSATNDGWSAYDKDGCTWPTDAEAAEQLEAARTERNIAAGKPTS